MYYLISIVLGYLFGCLQTSYFIGKLKKVNLKSSGNGNAGASNTTVVLGWKYGIIVAVVDILKAVIPIFLMKFLLEDVNMINDIKNFIIYLTGAMVIVGHNHPFFMNFKGGKGTASAIGLMIAIDWKIGLIGLLAIILFTLLTDYIVFGTMALYISLIIYTYLMDIGYYSLFVALFIFILSIINHWENFIRLKNKEEIGLSKVIKKNK